MKKLEKRVKRYLPVELDVDTSYLNNTQVNNCEVSFVNQEIQGVFFTGPPPKKLKYGKQRLGEVR